MELIWLIVSNYYLVFLVVSLIVGGVAIARLPKPHAAGAVPERFLAWYCFFVIGANMFVNFVFHSFFGELSAEFIGWADSPFQFEVAVASLGFAVVGFMAFWWKVFALRVAAVVGPAMFSLGAAAGHIVQMVTEHNFAPGNAGVVFWTDIIIPVWGAALLWWFHRDSKKSVHA